jgi:hypothetical protein
MGGHGLPAAQLRKWHSQTDFAKIQPSRGGLVRAATHASAGHLCLTDCGSPTLLVLPPTRYRRASAAWLTEFTNQWTVYKYQLKLKYETLSLLYVIDLCDPLVLFVTFPLPHPRPISRCGPYGPARWMVLHKDKMEHLLDTWITVENSNTILVTLRKNWRRPPRLRFSVYKQRPTLGPFQCPDVQGSYANRER